MNTRERLTDQELQAVVVLFAAFVGIFTIIGAIGLYLAGRIHL